MFRNPLLAFQIPSPATNFFTFSSLSLFNSSLDLPSLSGPSSVFLHLVLSTITTIPLTPISLLTPMLPIDFLSGYFVPNGVWGIHRLCKMGIWVQI
ncbi:hypothetical protein IC582_009729 [Cucumis melo]|uniref:Uncharacterized protein n=1 Tax=Cucumis melo TaxID=3656 RepID=A0A9I9D8U4_CUCME